MKKGQLIIASVLGVFVSIAGCYLSLDVSNDSEADDVNIDTEMDYPVISAADTGGGECDPAVLDMRPCGQHPEFDGVGACRPGSQYCIRQEDDTWAWGPCNAGVGPSIESCGPDAPDTNCNGVQGDGDGCMKTLKIYAELRTYQGTEQLQCGDEGHLGGSDGSNCGSIKAVDAPPEDTWRLLTSFPVFTEPYPNTRPVRNCIIAVTPWSEPERGYVQIGETCEPLNTDLDYEFRDLGVVGYVSAKSAAGFSRLFDVPVNFTHYGSSDSPLSRVPAARCPSNCSCEPSRGYTVL